MSCGQVIIGDGCRLDPFAHVPAGSRLPSGAVVAAQTSFEAGKQRAAARAAKPAAAAAAAPGADAEPLPSRGLSAAQTAAWQVWVHLASHAWERSCRHLPILCIQCTHAQREPAHLLIWHFGAGGGPVRLRHGQRMGGPGRGVRAGGHAGRAGPAQGGQPCAVRRIHPGRHLQPCLRGAAAPAHPGAATLLPGGTARCLSCKVGSTYASWCMQIA